MLRVQVLHILGMLLGFDIVIVMLFDTTLSLTIGFVVPASEVEDAVPAAEVFGECVIDLFLGGGMFAVFVRVGAEIGRLGIDGVGQFLVVGMGVGCVVGRVFGRSTTACDFEADDGDV